MGVGKVELGQLESEGQRWDSRIGTWTFVLSGAWLRTIRDGAKPHHHTVLFRQACLVCGA